MDNELNIHGIVSSHIENLEWRRAGATESNMNLEGKAPVDTVIECAVHYTIDEPRHIWAG